MTATELIEVLSDMVIRLAKANKELYSLAAQHENIDDDLLISVDKELI